MTDAKVEETEPQKATRLLNEFKKAQQGKDKIAMVAALRLFNACSDDAKRAAKENSAGDFKVGRRVALNAEGGHESEMFIKLTLCGSGNEKWVTQETASGWVPCDAKAGGSLVQAWSRGSEMGPEFMFSGPLDTLGALDKGSNSIQRIEEAAVAVVSDVISKTRELDSDKTFRVLIRAHSRGGVAGTLVANVLNDLGCKVELTAFDPVPGPKMALGKRMTDASHAKYDTYLEQDLGGLDESTLIYAMNAHRGISFKPEKVSGAKRIIISRQDHAGGQQNGYRFDGQLFKGTGIANLPDGVYIDRNETGSNKKELVQVQTIDAFRSMLRKMWDTFEIKDDGREARINSAVNEYFAGLV